MYTYVNKYSYVYHYWLFVALLFMLLHVLFIGRLGPPAGSGLRRVAPDKYRHIGVT